MWGTLIDVWVHWGTGGWVEAMGGHTPLPPLLSAPTSRAASPYSGRQGLRPGGFVSRQRGTGEAHTELPRAVPRQRGDMGHIGGPGPDVEIQQTHSTSVTGAAIAPTSPAASIHLSTCPSIHPAFSQPSGWLSLSIPYRSIPHPSVCPPVSPWICHLSISLLIHPLSVPSDSIHLPVHHSSPTIHPFIRPSTPLSIHPWTHRSMHLSVHPCMRLSVQQSLCPST